MLKLVLNCIKQFVKNNCNTYINIEQKHIGQYFILSTTCVWIELWKGSWNMQYISEKLKIKINPLFYEGNCINNIIMHNFEYTAASSMLTTFLFACGRFTSMYLWTSSRRVWTLLIKSSTLFNTKGKKCCKTWIN